MLKSEAPGANRQLNRQSNRQQGFSLVELAISMLIVALVLGALLRPLANQIEQQKYHQTEKDLEEIRQALYGFAMANGRLPRPARSELDGRETESCGEDEKTGKDNGCSGFIPFTTLGVTRADAYGKLYMYSVSRNFTDSAPLAFDQAGVWSIQTRMSAQPSTLVPLAEKIVAVVRSFGARSFGRSVHGTDIANETAAGTNIDEIFNSGVGPSQTFTFRYRAPSTQDDPRSGGAFDDQMIWIPTSLYMRQMVLAGRVPSTAPGPVTRDARE